MKVSELARVTQKGQYFNVLINEEYLDGDYPEDYLECDFEIENVCVGACETLLVYGTKNRKEENHEQTYQEET